VAAAAVRAQAALLVVPAFPLAVAPWPAQVPVVPSPVRVLPLQVLPLAFHRHLGKEKLDIRFSQFCGIVLNHTV